MATVEDVANNVKRKRNIPTTNTTTFPYAWFYDAISEALRLMHKEVPGWVSAQTVNTVAGTASYALAAGTIEVRRVWISGYEPMTPINERDSLLAVTFSRTGQPMGYTVHIESAADTTAPTPWIAFDVVPDDAYTVLLVTHNTWATTLSATNTTIGVPTEWIDCLVMFLVAMSYERDEDPGMADRWFAKAGDKLMQIKAIDEDRYNAGFLSAPNADRIKIVGGQVYEV